jgi:hypothetical protein
MNFDADDLEIAYWCAAVAIQSRRENRKPIPDELRRHHNRLDLAIKCMSDPGHEIDQEPSQLEPDELITTQEMATTLNCSQRQAQRLAERDLDGQLVGGRWLCRRSIVETYAQGRKPA